MKPNKNNFIIILSLSFLLITSIIITFIVGSNYEGKLTQLNTNSYYLKQNINRLLEENDEFKEKYNALLYEIEQKSKSRKINLPMLPQPPILIYRTLVDLELKTEMTEDCATITTIPQGVKVEVLDSFFGRIWRVRYRGNIGWVKADGTLEKVE